MEYISFDPYYLIENKRFPVISDAVLEDMLKTARKGRLHWSETDCSTRAGFLRSLGEILRDESAILGELITSEMGKPVRQAVGEVEKCATLCFWYADNLNELLQPEIRKSSAEKSMVFFSPQGIILGIMPWNFPFWQALRFIIPVVAGGNTVMLKHASNVPCCAREIEMLFLRAGFPASVVTNLFISYDQVKWLLARDEVRGVSLTGSSRAGEIIAQTAGRCLKKSVLELGGSDPLIIMDDADLEAAADGALFGRFQNCGQSCIAAKRLFVHSSRYEQFMEIFTGKVKELKCGNPHEMDTYIGPLVNRMAFEEIDSLVRRSVAMGARLVIGGYPFSVEKSIYLPTILTDVAEDAPVMNDEVFGPVIPVTGFESLNEVAEMANKTRFGLGASVWSSSYDKALKLAEKLDTGVIAVNGFVRSDPALPFGGVKYSGFGRELSVEGFREFLNIKCISFYG